MCRKYVLISNINIVAPNKQTKYISSFCHEYMVHLIWIYIKKLFIDKTPPNIHRWSTTVHLYKTIHMQYWLIIAAIVILQLFHCNDVPLVWWKKDHTKGVWFALILKVPRVFSRHQPAFLSCHRYRKEYRNHDNQETWKNKFFTLLPVLCLLIINLGFRMHTGLACQRLTNIHQWKYVWHR